MNFEAPIPGMSLTGSPGKYPWERPPEIVDPEEALMLHLERLSTRDKIEDMLDMLELGVDVRSLTEGLLRSAVAEGIHTVDVSLLIAPVVHEYIKDTAERAGIEFDEGLVDPDEKKKRKPVELALSKKKVQSMLAEHKKKLPDDDLGSLGFGEDDDDEDEMDDDEPMSLIQRRAT